MSNSRGIRRPRVAGHPLAKASMPTAMPGGLALPTGSTVADATSMLNSLQARTQKPMEGMVPLDRSEGFWSLFGPGAPLYPAPLNNPNQMTGQADPRQTEYPVSINILSNDRPVAWSTLRDAADKVDIIRLCLRTRKEEITSLEWGFGFTKDAEQALDITSPQAKKEMRGKYEAQLTKLKDFWSTPDKTNDLSWSEWLGMLLEERFVLDALSIFPRLTYGGDLASLEIIDGSTIKPLIDEYGNRPAHPAPAYQQWLYGFPRGEYTDSGASDNWEGGAGSLIYKPYNRRTQTPYGFPEVEQALVSADIYLRRQDWMRKEYTAGTMPTAWLQVDAAMGSMTPEQHRAWEVVLNDYYTGSNEERHRMKMLPTGVQAIPQKDVAERYKADYDEFLVKLLCAHMATQPSEIGFTPSQGLGGSGFSAGQEDVNYRKSILPTLSWLTDLVNSISRQYLGMPPELTIQFLGLEAEDEATADAVNLSRVITGRMTLNEDRDRTGMPRYDFAEADMPVVIDRSGVVFLEGAAATAPPGVQIKPPQAPPGYDANAIQPDAPKPASQDAGVQAPTKAPDTAAGKPAVGTDAKKAEVSQYRKFIQKTRSRGFEWVHHTPEEVAELLKADDAGERVLGGGTPPRTRSSDELSQREDRSGFDWSDSRL